MARVARATSIPRLLPLRGRTVLGVPMNQSVPIVPLAPLALCLTCSTRSYCLAAARVAWTTLVFPRDEVLPIAQALQKARVFIIKGLLKKQLVHCFLSYGSIGAKLFPKAQALQKVKLSYSKLYQTKQCVLPELPLMGPARQHPEPEL